MTKETTGEIVENVDVVTSNNNNNNLENGTKYSIKSINVS